MFRKQCLIFFGVISLMGLLEAKSCKDLLRELADAQQKFIFCVTSHAVPVTMCKGCHTPYENLGNIYSLLESNPNCTDEYFDKDRINIITTTQSLMTGLFEKAFCDDCFSSNHSEVFEDKLRDHTDCLDRNKRHECEACLFSYESVNNFYISLDQNNNGQVCFDMQDAMNRTRLQWSKVLKCCRRESNMTLFLVASLFAGFLPFAFYLTLFFYTKRRERNHGTLTEQDAEFRPAVGSSNRTAPLITINEPPEQVTENPTAAATSQQNGTKRTVDFVESDSSDEDGDNIGDQKKIKPAKPLINL